MTFKTLSALAVVGVLGLSVTGCSVDVSKLATPVTATIEPTQSEAPVAAPEPETSTRGNLMKTIGEIAGYSTASGDPQIRFKVTEINTDFTCTSPDAAPSDNGSFIAVSFEIETFPSYVDYGLFNGVGWKMIAVDGTTYNHDLVTFASFLCLNPSESLPNDIGPGEKISGTVVVDAPATEGTLIIGSYDTAWEYVLGRDDV